MLPIQASASCSSISLSLLLKDNLTLSVTFHPSTPLQSCFCSYQSFETTVPHTLPFPRIPSPPHPLTHCSGLFSAPSPWHTVTAEVIYHSLLPETPLASATLGFPGSVALSLTVFLASSAGLRAPALALPLFTQCRVSPCKNRWSSPIECRGILISISSSDTPCKIKIGCHLAFKCPENSKRTK